MAKLSLFFFSSRRRHTRCSRDWSSDVCSSDLPHACVAVRLQLKPDRQLVSRTGVRLLCASHPFVDAERSEEHTSELQSRLHLVCRLLLEKKKRNTSPSHPDTCYFHVSTTKTTL